jgi:hypothetical protein
MAIEQYVTSEVIAGRLNSQFRTFEFDRSLVAEYCARVEVEHFGDIDTMWKFEEIPLIVGFEKSVLLPCNVYRIIEVYDENEDRITYNKTNTHLFALKNITNGDDYKEGDTVYINYIGIPVDTVTGEILIPSGHELACETFCKVKFFEEDAMLRKIDPNMWREWNILFSNQVMAAKSSYRHRDKTHDEQLNIIRGNMLAMIGRMPFSHNQFE